MPKALIDPEALISMFETASAKQSADLRKAVSDATLQALQGRELTLKNIRAALKAVSEAPSPGAAKNLMPGVDAEALLDKAVAGMDDALLKAVDANRVALGQLVSQGADLREKHLKKALADLDKFEDTMFAAFKKAADGVGGPMAGAWSQVLEKMQAGGTLSGAQAAEHGRSNWPSRCRLPCARSRAAAMRAVQAMAESYTAMVSGVLLGMSDALQAGAAPKKTPIRRQCPPRRVTHCAAMKNVVISGTGLYRPPNIITNAELVEAFNAYADLQNEKNATRIAAGDGRPMVHSSVEFIEKASGIKQRYVLDKAGVLDPTRMRPKFEPRPDEAL